MPPSRFSNLDRKRPAGPANIKHHSHNFVLRGDKTYDDEYSYHKLERDVLMATFRTDLIQRFDTWPQVNLVE